MALKLYNPRTKAFAVITAPDSLDIPFAELLALNTLIELKAQTHYLSAITEAVFKAANLDMSESPEDVITDIVSFT